MRKGTISARLGNIASATWMLSAASSPATRHSTRTYCHQLSGLAPTIPHIARCIPSRAQGTEHVTKSIYPRACEVQQLHAEPLKIKAWVDSVTEGYLGDGHWHWTASRSAHQQQNRHPQRQLRRVVTSSSLADAAGDDRTPKGAARLVLCHSLKFGCLGSNEVCSQPQETGAANARPQPPNGTNATETVAYPIVVPQEFAHTGS